jgi:hypothetical protein
MINERPILFQTEMVKAILEGRKNQTRRTSGLEVILFPEDFTLKRMQVYPNGSLNAVFEYDGELGSVKSRYGKPGDLLWVRETWNESFDDEGYFIAYKADDHCIDWKWKPSIHMPKSAARIWLMIEDIRVERLHDITPENAVSEGIEFTNSDNILLHGWKCYTKKDLDEPNFFDPLSSFDSLWISIN